MGKKIASTFYSFPRSAFFWYSQDARSKVRAANPDFGVGDIAKELGRQWGEASDETRDGDGVLGKFQENTPIFNTFLLFPN